VLLTAFAMAGATDEVYRSDLVIECWGRDSATFGLRGRNAQFPDAKRVDTEIAHLVNAEHLERVRPLYYRITDAGVAKVRTMQTRKGAAS
jgi:hypothetical protein